MRTKVLVLLAAALGALVFGSGVAVATPPSGFKLDFIKQGRLATPTEISRNGIEFSTAGPTDVFTQKVILDPAGYSGWHMHAGLTVVTVIEGSVTELIGCHSPAVYGEGQSFIEPPMTPGNVKNTSNTIRAVVLATLIVPADVKPRLDSPPPDCTNHKDDTED